MTNEKKSITDRLFGQWEKMEVSAVVYKRADESNEVKTKPKNESKEKTKQGKPDETTNERKTQERERKADNLISLIQKMKKREKQSG